MHLDQKVTVLINRICTISGHYNLIYSCTDHTFKIRETNTTTRHTISISRMHPPTRIHHSPPRPWRVSPCRHPRPGPAPAARRAAPSRQSTSWRLLVVEDENDRS